MTEPSRSRSRRRLVGAILSLIVLAAVVPVAVPVLLLRPFSYQSPGGIALAFSCRQWAPLITVLALVAGLAPAVWLWRGGRRRSRVLVALALVLMVGTVWLSRFQMFEHMFAPPGSVRSAPLAQATWVKDGDMVLAVTRNGDAASYPINQVAYHHIVQDVVGGVPVAVTY